MYLEFTGGPHDGGLCDVGDPPPLVVTVVLPARLRAEYTADELADVMPVLGPMYEYHLTRDGTTGRLFYLTRDR